MSDRKPDQRLPDGVRLVRPLGAGAMGEVWVGDTIREGEVAVKFLAEAVRHDPSAVQRFEREWKMASAIDSPHVVRMITRGELPDGLPYIVMELLKGESLEERLERRSRLSPEEALDIFHQVASALDVAHERGIVHRDIKPENILLCGPESRVKLLDFGLAKPFSSDGFSLTKTGVLMGTPFYMAPEQIQQGGRDFDGRADHWALAAVAYRTLFGRQPFDADSLHALVLTILRGNYVPLSECGGEPALEPFFARAFAVERDDRFASATAMIDALDRVVENGFIDEPTQVDIDGDDWDEEELRTREYRAGELLGGEQTAPETMRLGDVESDLVEDGAALSGPMSVEPPTRHRDESMVEDTTIDRESGLPAEMTAVLDEPTPPVASNEPRTVRWHATGPLPPPELDHPATEPQPRSRGRRWLSVVVGLNLVAVVVLAAFMVTRRSPERRPSSAATSSAIVQPAPATASVDASPEASTSSPPRGEHPASSKRAHPVSSNGANPAPRGAGAATAAAASDDPDAAMLTVRCAPVCIVIVDGVSHGVSPLRKGRFRPGKHDVAVYRDDLGTKSARVDLQRGRHVIHEVDLRAR